MMPTILGDYHLPASPQLLGHGAFAVVFLGHHNQTQEKVAVRAIKRRVLISSALNNELAVLQELTSLHHNNIISLLHCQKTSDHLYMVTEYCNGGNFEEYLNRAGGRLPQLAIACFLKQMASAFSAMQKCQVVHRDLKPANILLHHSSRHLTFKIADFGFARILQQGNMAVTLCGSPIYMAPEIHTQQSYCHKADLFSLGVITYQSLTGHAPFLQNSYAALVKFYKRSPCLSVRFPEEVDGQLRDLINRLLVKWPPDRIPFDDFFKHPFIIQDLKVHQNVDISSTVDRSNDMSGINIDDDGSDDEKGDDEKGDDEKGDDEKGDDEKADDEVNKPLKRPASSSSSSMDNQHLMKFFIIDKPQSTQNQATLKQAQSTQNEIKSTQNQIKSTLKQAPSTQNQIKSTLKQAPSTQNQAKSTLKQAQSTIKHQPISIQNQSTIKHQPISIQNQSIIPVEQVVNRQIKNLQQQKPQLQQPHPKQQQHLKQQQHPKQQPYLKQQPQHQQHQLDKKQQQPDKIPQQQPHKQQPHKQQQQHQSTIDDSLLGDFCIVGMDDVNDEQITNYRYKSEQMSHPSKLSLPPPHLIIPPQRIASHRHQGGDFITELLTFHSTPLDPTLLMTREEMQLADRLETSKDLACCLLRCAQDCSLNQNKNNHNNNNNNKESKNQFDLNRKNIKNINKENNNKMNKDNEVEGSREQLKLLLTAWQLLLAGLASAKQHLSADAPSNHVISCLLREMKVRCEELAKMCSIAVLQCCPQTIAPHHLNDNKYINNINRGNNNNKRSIRNDDKPMKQLQRGDCSAKLLLRHAFRTAKRAQIEENHGNLEEAYRQYYMSNTLLHWTLVHASKPVDLRTLRAYKETVEEKLNILKNKGFVYVKYYH